MIDYVESFNINGTRCGIEDYEAPGRHFFLDRPHKRFKCWVGGCAICHGHDLLAEAQHHMDSYMGNQLHEQYAEATKKAKGIATAACTLRTCGLAGVHEVKDDDHVGVDTGSHPQDA